MAKTRDLNHSSIIVGRKATGKSTLLATIARKYPKDSRVLVLDVNGSPAYNGFTTIQAADLPRWKSRGIAKLMGTPTDETLELIANNFRGGLIIFEDCTKYIEANVKPNIKSFLVDHRMHQVDLIFTFHSLNRVPRFFWEMISYVTLLKTQDSFDKTYKNKVPNYDKMAEAFRKVNAHPDNYYSMTIETMI